jgi:NAD(P)-dependent dehydrogenase (short-subunit alcohol dehydrogenase family)
MARYEIAGRVILITGAAQGIGRDAAGRLAQRGARLALIDRDADGVGRAAAEIGDAAEPFGGIDVAIANAGISGTPTPARFTDHDEFERVIETNVLGVWRTLHAVIPDVVERRGYLLPIASIAAAVPVPLAPAYGASKAAVHSLARTLRIELAHTGARVGAGYFGFIDTPMLRNASANPLAGRAMRSVPGPISRPVPVGAVGEAIVRGVERRAKRVFAPRWVSAVVALSGFGGPIEALVARDPRLVRVLREAEEEQAPPRAEPDVQEASR